MSISYITPKILNLYCNSPKQLSVDWELARSFSGYSLDRFVLKETSDEGTNEYTANFTGNQNDLMGTFTVNINSGGIQKQYTIQAVYTYNSGNGTISSLISQAYSFTVIDKPTKPTILNINNSFNRRLDINWNSTSRGSEIQYIDVSYSGAYTDIKRLDVNNPLSIVDLSAGQYTVQIRVIPELGSEFYSEYSDISNVEVYEILSKPLINSIADISLNTVNVSFALTSPNTSPATSAEYKYTYNSGTINTFIGTSLINANGNSFNAILSNPNITGDWIYGRNYDIQFRLLNSVGWSVYSDVSYYIPNTTPDAPTGILFEPIGGSYITNDCSAIVSFLCNNNGAELTEISGNFYSLAGIVLNDKVFNPLDLSLNGNIYTFTLPDIIYGQANNISFYCKNNNGYSEYSSGIMIIFFDKPIFPPIQTFEITTDGLITFTTAGGYFHSYDKIKYTYTYYSDGIPHSSNYITYDSLDFSGNGSSVSFSISNSDFIGEIIHFSFWLENKGLTSQQPAEIDIYMIPPSSPFISIIPNGEYIEMTYYINTSSPVNIIKYELNGEEYLVYYSEETNPITNPINIPLPDISNRSSTQSYTIRATFTNSFGESMWSNYSFINGDTITEYREDTANCRYVKIMPNNRFELTSPYDNGYTKEQLDARRKYEILQYFGKSSASDVQKKMTNNQRYALVSRGSYVRNSSRASGSLINDFSCVVEPASFFEIPLYNYSINRQYNINKDFPEEKQWYMNYIKNQEFSINIMNTMVSMYVNKFITAPYSNVRINSSLFIFVSGSVNQYGATTTFTISRCVINAVNRKTGGTITYSFIPSDLESFAFTPTLNSPSVFLVKFYCGDFDYIMNRFPTSNGDLYDINCKFTVSSDDLGVGGQYKINNTHVWVVSAGRIIG